MGPARSLPLVPARPRHAHSFLVAMAAAAAVFSSCRDDPPVLPAAPAPPPVAANRVDVFVHAHADDWTLFMGDRVAASLATSERVVFIHLTAGEAGRDAAYWKAREHAALAAAGTLVGPGRWSCAPADVLGHGVRHCVRGKASAWFLRLPDGNSGDGLGYGRGSLTRLRDGGTGLEAVDGSAAYASWAELVATVRGIVEREGAGAARPSVRVHAPEHERDRNPCDHPDHWAAGDAALAASEGRSWGAYWYTGYHLTDLPPNLSASAHAQKEREFGAYDRVMEDAGYGSMAANPAYQAYLQRTYVRVGAGAPAAPVARSAACEQHPQPHLAGGEWLQPAGE